MSLNMRRCEWQPLATQQLRLRNLTRIQGVNIQIPSTKSNSDKKSSNVNSIDDIDNDNKDNEADEDDDNDADDDEGDNTNVEQEKTMNNQTDAVVNDSAFNETYVYFTLHESNESVEFYKSEALPLRCCKQQQKWAEINCAAIRKSNANCVCVKVWLRVLNEKVISKMQQKTEGIPSVTHVMQDTAQLSQHIQQKQLELKKDPISALTKEFSNACLSPDNLPRPPDNDKLLFTWGVYFSGLILLDQNIEAKYRKNCLIFQLNGYYFTSSEHLITENLHEHLSLNYERYITRVGARSITPPIDEFAINLPTVSRSSSPVASSIDWQRTRYLQLPVARNETHRSYNLDKLLNIQELQRLHLQKRREIAELEDEIKYRCVHCITNEQLLRKPRTSSYQHHSMGRKLSILLAEEQIQPHTLLRAQQLQRQIETLRFRKRLLTAEHKTYTSRIQSLRERLCALTLMRQEKEVWLRTKLEAIQDEKDKLNERYQHQTELLQKKRHLMVNVERRMCNMCLDMRGIYPISRNEFGFFTICDIPLPNMEIFFTDTRYVTANTNNLVAISPNGLSTALGYLAHLVQMISIIINRPLRNPIKMESSRFRIVDVVKDIPYGSREFSLFTRSSIPAKSFKYAIYLLNQNIAQLCYDITGVRCDLRATIENLLYIFATLADLEKSRREIQTMTHPNNRIHVQHNHNNSSCNSNGQTGNSNSYLLAKPVLMSAAATPASASVTTKAKTTTSTATAIATVTTNDTIDFLKNSHSSIDMNHMTAPVPPVLTADDIACNMSSLLQLPSSQPLMIGGERNDSATLPRCRSVGSYSDCEDDFKDIVGQNYSNSDSNITFQSGSYAN